MPLSATMTRTSAPLLSSADANPAAGGSIFQRIADQILKDTTQRSLVAENGRQILWQVDLHVHVGPVDERGGRRDDVVEERFETNRAEREAALA